MALESRLTFNILSIHAVDEVKTDRETEDFPIFNNVVGQRLTALLKARTIQLNWLQFNYSSTVLLINQPQNTSQTSYYQICIRRNDRSLIFLLNHPHHTTGAPGSLYGFACNILFAPDKMVDNFLRNHFAALSAFGAWNSAGMYVVVLDQESSRTSAPPAFSVLLYGSTTRPLHRFLNIPVCTS